MTGGRIGKFLAVVIFGTAAIAAAPSAFAQVDYLYKIKPSKFAAHVDYFRPSLKPGEQLVLGDLSGPGRITYFYITDGSPAHISRDLTLKIYWDDAREPSVNVPLADFFGAFENKSVDYAALPMQVNHFSHMSYLPMPFSKRARFVLVNEGEKTFTDLLAWGIDSERDPAMARERSRFHAAWYRSNPVEKGIHTLLDVRGSGQYVGNFLHVKSNYKGWWGEGDTIFEVDGVKITHSPGTEDEYGSTWGFGDNFTLPTSGYQKLEPNNYRLYRWYLANPVRFSKSLKVYIQNQRIIGTAEDHKNDPQAFMKYQTVSQDDYTSIAYWYQDGAHPVALKQSYDVRVSPTRGADYAPPK